MIQFSIKKYPLATVILVILLATTATLCLANEKNQTEEVKNSSKIIAKVNGQPIYEDQVVAVIQSRLGRSKYSQSTSDDDLQDKKLQKIALDQIIPSELIYQESQKLTIPDIENRINKLVETFKNHPLGHYKNKSEKELHNLAKRQILAGEYFDVNKLYTPDISESELKEYYDKNKQSFAYQTDSVHLQHIIVMATDEMTSEQREASLNKINEARALISEGKSFNDIAKTYSEDYTANKGGDLGIINRGYMPPEVDAVAFTIEPEKLSEVLRSSVGYHLLTVHKVIYKGEIPPYENLKDFFKKFLQEQKSQKVIENHILALKEKSHIEIFIDN